MRTLLGLLAVVSLVGCGDDGGSSGGDGGAQDSGGGDAAPIDGAIDAPIDMMIDGPPGTFRLTVKNVAVWCAVSVNGGQPSSAAVQVIDVAPGAIPITASALSGFKIVPNMWHHTDGDSGSGETGDVTGSGASAVSAVIATISNMNKCVWLCCPFENSGGGCPTTEQCL